MTGVGRRDAEIVSANTIAFGAAYYCEYLPRSVRTAERLAVDLDLMSAAGFTTIRVGESVWSTWEPREGEFDLEWLQPVLDAASARDIGVVIGTPTYAVPPWLRRRYPASAAQRRTGEPIPYGHRQDIDYTDPDFRRLAERLVSNIVTRYAGHPAVRGWQVDNEPGIQLLHNPRVFAEFVQRLRLTYGDVSALNEAWGLTYWSHRIADWDDLWTPDGNTVPAYDLAWRRFQADITTEFIAWQTEIVRKHARSDQFVTTCLALGRPAADAAALAALADVPAVNVYVPVQDALTLPDPPTPAFTGRPEWMPAGGLWSLYQAADTAWGLRQGPFLVTETGASSIGEPHVNHPPFDGQWRQSAWALVARGARMVEYWHWHTLHSGHETFWGGVLGHSLEPGRCYHELARIGAELRASGDDLRGLVPDADAAIYTSPASRWALQFQPPLADASGAPATGSYDQVVGSFYRGLFESGAQLAVSDTVRTDVPLLVAAGHYAATDAELDALLAHAADGGHLVLGIRTGYADEYARPRVAVAPDRLAVAAGVRYDEFTNVGAPVPVRIGGDEAGLATGWADGLVAVGAEVVATYDHPHLASFAAITTRPYGRGRITYVGTVPDPRLARAVGRWLRAHTAGTTDRALHLLPSVTVTTATNAAGRRLRFISNWSWQPVEWTVPYDARQITTGDRFRAGDPYPLGAWDVRVLIDDESSREDTSP